MMSLLCTWLASSFLAIGYDWLCAPEQFVEMFHGTRRSSFASLVCAFVTIVVGGPVALVATIIYHGKWR